LSYSDTYELVLVPETLYSASGAVVTFGEPRKYSTIAYDNMCNGVGTYNKITQRCNCDMSLHRAGLFCESCDIGFHFDANKKCVRYYYFILTYYIYITFCSD
jgi:hypothetical protein